MRFLLPAVCILFTINLLGQKPEYARLAGPAEKHPDVLEQLFNTDPAKVTTISPEKLSGSGNDLCSEAITLTVGNAFTCGGTSSNSAASSFPSTCLSTSGSGIQQYRTDWYCFNSGNNKTLAIVLNSVTNTTSYNPGIAVFGPYTSCASGCSSSMSGPLCDNVLTFPTDSIKILENLSPNAYYLVAIMERRSNPDISNSRSISYCIGVQPTNLDDCEISASGCPSTCGQLCVYGQANVPDPNDVVANCVEQEFSHRIQGSTIASPSDTVEFCYDFQVDNGCTVSFSTVVSVSGCSGPGNIGAPNWRIYNTSTCSVVNSGSSVPISASVSTAGNYIFCFKYSAACVYHFGTWIFGYGTCVIVNPVLPVSLSAFEVSEQGNAHVLNWTTLSELNNSYFDIERSRDGSNFSSVGTIGSLAPGGNSNSKLDYRFTVNQPFPGNNYYRLKQVDHNGEYSYSQIVVARKTTGSFRFLGNTFSTVSGGPAIIFEEAESSQLNITVNDYTGKLIHLGKVQSQPGINTFLMPARNLEKGIYIISLVKDNGQTITTKFSKF